jgi:hypothetical protein
MFVESEWKKRVSHELDRAEAARQSGNEGMARVCARRAAGLIIGEYLEQKAIPSTEPSAYDRMKLLLDLPGVSERAREITENLVRRVNKDFTLPVEADLIEETRRLAEELLGENV